MSASPNPAGVLSQWAAHPEGLAEVPAGRTFDVVRVLAQPGAEALARLRDRDSHLLGPVLHCIPRDCLEFLVPVGTAEAWDLPRSRCVGLGRRLRCPMPGHRGAGRYWLLPPDGSGKLNDVAALRNALEGALLATENAEPLRIS